MGIERRPVPILLMHDVGARLLPGFQERIWDAATLLGAHDFAQLSEQALKFHPGSALQPDDLESADHERVDGLVCLPALQWSATGTDALCYLGSKSDTRAFSSLSSRSVAAILDFEKSVSWSP